MISLFLGLSVANLLIMTNAAGLGLAPALLPATTGSDYYAIHITIGIASGMMACLTHMIVYAYFMATSKWLGAATDKEDLDTRRFVSPALEHKRRALTTVIAPIAMVMLTLFAGAAADPTQSPWLPKGIHLFGAAATVMVNLIVAVVQFRLIIRQGRLMDDALAILNNRIAMEMDPADAPTN